jgi:hypothetical protein
MDGERFAYRQVSVAVGTPADPELTTIPVAVALQLARPVLVMVAATVFETVQLIA